MSSNLLIKYRAVRESAQAVRQAAEMCARFPAPASAHSLTIDSRRFR